jgi:hypothetical protein
LALPPDTTPPRSEKAAAQHAAQQDVFLREVDDALRADQLEGALSRYGKPLLAVVVLGLAAFGGWLYWHHQQVAAREQRIETFVQALDGLQAGNLDGAKDKLAPLAATDGSDAGVVSSRLVLAGIALKQGRQADALKLYGQVANDGDAPQPMRDLATIRSVAAQFDALPPQQVVDRLKPLAVPGNAWFGAAGELVGMAYLKQNKADQAGPLFAAIAKDEGQDAGLRSRARQLAAVLGVDAVPDVVDDKGEPFSKVTAKVVTAAGDE